jgi:hypothetical protein
MDTHLLGIDLAELLLKKRAEKPSAEASAPDTNSIATEKDRLKSR